MTKYGYCRVSTQGQELDEQIETLRREGVSSKNIFHEKVSGTVKADKRPAFARMMAKLAPGDEIVVTKLDRLGRTTLDILTTLEAMKSDGIAVTIIGIGTIRDDMIGRLTTNLLAAFAEFERSIIVDRMQSGRKRSTDNGNKMGRKHKLSKQAMAAIISRYGNPDTRRILATEYGVDIRTIERTVKRHRINYA